MASLWPRGLGDEGEYARGSDNPLWECALVLHGIDEVHDAQLVGHRRVTGRNSCRGSVHFACTQFLAIAAPFLYELYHTLLAATELLNVQI